jgi:hypothetical protein
MLEIPFCEGNRANDIVGYHVGRSKYFLQWKVTLYNTCSVGRDSTVDIVTTYGLEGSGIISWWSEIFRTSPHLP